MVISWYPIFFLPPPKGNRALLGDLAMGLGSYSTRRLPFRLGIIKLSPLGPFLFFMGARNPGAWVKFGVYPNLVAVDPPAKSLTIWGV